jgi:amino acid adenylation domain-containing protein
MEKTDLAKDELLALLLEEEEGLNVLEEEGLNVYTGQEEIVARDKTVGEPSPEKTELVKEELLALFLEEEGLDVSTGKEIVARDKTVGELPLSFAQQRLWFLDQLIPESPAYNIPVAVRLTGMLRIAVLEQTFTDIVRRHEVLRTTFTVGQDDQPVQIIETSDLTISLPIIDLQALSPVEQPSEIQRLAIEEANRPFDLVKGPLLRLTLLQLSTETYVLLLTMHHVISDGWSIAIFIQEVAALYEAFSKGKPSPLSALPIQYADFAIWQRKWLEEEGVLETQINYWKQQLAGAPLVLELPTDHPRPAIQSFKGNIEKFEINEELTRQLNTLSQQSGTSFFMTLLAAFVVLLSRYSSQKDIVIGSPIANRNRSETEFLIGFFVNTLLMRITLSEKMTFSDLLMQTKQVALEAYDHQDIPFEQLVETLQPARNLSHSPLFQVMFALQNAPTRPLEMLDLNLEVLEVETTLSKFDLTLDIEESDSVLKGTFEYNTDLFEVATIIRMIEHFKTLLAGIIAHPECQVTQLPLLNQTEKDQLLNKWNETQVSYLREEQCFPQLFEAQVERTPTAVAVIFQDQQITYQDLNTRANQLAYYLQTLGVQSETLVGLCVERSLEMIIGLLGILKAGGSYIPLDPNFPKERLAFMLEDAQVTVLLTQEKLARWFNEYQVQAVCLDKDWDKIAQENWTNPISDLNKNHLAYTIYTSGSTGKPKGVQIQHQSLTNFLYAIGKQFDINEQDILLAVTTISFDIAALELYLPLIVGAKIILANREESSDGILLLEKLNQAGVTVMQATPATWHLLLAAGWQKSHQLKILCGGEALPCELAKQLLARGQSVWNLYGPTETTIWSTLYLVKEPRTTTLEVPELIGRPINNTQVYILDAHLQLVPIGVHGELHIGGKGLARGYLNRPELTTEKFIKNPFSDDPYSRLYKTGDLTRYRPDGNIEYLGRIDNQVKIRGFRIELGEIEAVLGQHPFVQENAVIVHETSATDKRLVAYIVSHKGQLIEKKEDLRAFLKERLPDYMVPSVLVTLDALPLTPNGKIYRQALSNLSVSHECSEEQFVAPRTPEEELLAGIFADVLSAPQVGVHDNFFELGGHSLLATQVMSRIRDTFEVELPLRELFESPTIGGLSELLSTKCRSAATLPPVTLVDREQPLSLSFAQQRLWFLNQLEGENATYNIPIALRLEGALHQNALLMSLQTLIQRHENLRTVFPTQKGQPVVQIVEKPFQLSVLDLSTLSLVLQQSEVQRLVNEYANRPFNLETGPLFRATLLQLGSKSYVLLLNMHHIIADGWSLWVLLQELSVLYEAFLLEITSPLPPLSIQYIDFAHWQRQWLTGEVLEQQLSYWKQQLVGVPTLLELPTDQPRSPIQSYQGANLPFSLSPKLTEQLQHLSQQAGTTLFMTLLAAFATLLSRYSGQSDIVIGSPIANRTHSFLESMIGLFVNTLVLRLSFEDNPPFIEVLQQARKVTLEAYDHQDIPFEQLVEELQPERSLSHSPLFQVMFDLQSVEMPMELAELTVTPVEVESTIAKFDLTLSMEETAQGLIGVFEYSTDLFELATIERLKGHFLTLLTSMVEKPQLLIHELPLLTKAEQQQFLAWNKTTVDYPLDKTIADLFEEQVEQTPNAVAVVFKDQQLIYKELNTQANQIAHYLRRSIKHNEFVGILEERGIDFLAAMLGILKAGGAFLPIDPSYPDDRVLYMVNNSQIHSLITRSTLFAKIATDVEKSGYLRQVLYLDGAKELGEGYQFYNSTELAGEPKHNPSSLNESIDIAYMLYTSGSTGLPKGAMVRHNGAVNHIYAQFDQLAFHQNTAFLQSASSSSDISVWQFLAPLLIGGRTIIVDFETVCDSAKLFQVIKSQQVTLIELVPVVMQGVLELVAQLPPEEQALPALEWAMVTGEAVSTSLVNQWLQTYPKIKLVNAYGPTEVADDICQAVLEKPLPKEQINVPIGKPLANLSLYVLDPQQQLLPIGLYGEICVAGVGVGTGYWRDEKKTKASFVNNPHANDTYNSVIYRTGDLGRWLPDGSLEFIGRLDDQVKIRGFRIELGEIEAVLGQYPLIAQNSVIVKETSQTDKRLVAYLVPNKEQVLENTALRTFLEERLPVHMIPSAFITLEALPLTPNGKVDRRALARLSVSYDRLEEQFIAPRTPEEELLATIWAEVLDVSQVGVHDNFFELGGHSLLATQVISRIRDTFELELPVRVLFESPTIQTLSEHLGNVRRESALQPITLVNRNEPLPLSFAQLRLWFLNQLEGNSATYNIPAALRLEGPLHQNPLLRSLQTLVQRHENLRTVFPTLKGQPVIKIVDKPFQVNTLSLTALSLEKQQLEVQRLVNSDANRPFDLEIGPLFRATLLQLSAESHILLLNMHHIISDDWSLGVLIREWRVLYEAFVQDQASPLPPLPIQYVDFAHWQRQWLRDDVLEKQIDYWKQQLAGAPALLGLPTDHPRPPVQRFQGTSLPIFFSKELSEQLKHLSQQSGTTLFITLLSAFATLLSRYSGQNDIVIGSPIANRTHSQTESLIGFFVNTLVLRLNLSDNPPFETLLQQARRVALEAYTHQDIPFEQLVEKLQPARDISHSPLFQVMLVLQNAPQSSLELSGLTLTPLEMESTIAKFDLTLSIEETDQGIMGELNYNTDLFEATTIERLREHLYTLLTGLVANPQQPIHELPLLTEAEQKQLLAWNDTATDYPHDKTIVDLFEEQVEQTPDAVAVIFEDQQLTYQDLNSKANQLAHYIQDLGVKPEVLVGIYVERSPEMIIGLLGILKAGGAYVPFDPVYPTARLTFMLEDTKVLVLLTQSSLIEKLPKTQAQVVCLDVEADALSHLSAKNPTSGVVPTNLAYVIYTSGSTGQPKGVMIEHLSVINLLNGLYQTLYTHYKNSQLRVSMNGALTFDTSVKQLIQLLHGHVLDIIPEEVRFNKEALLAYLQTHQINVFDCTPSHLNLFSKELVSNTSSVLHSIIIGGEPLDDLTWQFLQKTEKTSFYNIYGPTECTVDATVSAISNALEKPVIGCPLANIQIYILDCYQRPVPIGVPGELHIGGAGLARGYLNRPELTVEKFIKNPFSEERGSRLYKTGDLARYRPDGNIEYLGRIDNQVKIRGFRIELSEIEAVLGQHFFVKESAVVVHEISQTDKRLVAYLVPHQGQEIENTELRGFLTSLLPDYMIPSALVTLETLPLTPNGKIDRRTLSMLSVNYDRSEEQFVAPRTPEEELLAGIWAEVLSISQVGVHDNFFELGGHSLLATQLMSRIRDSLEVELPLRFMFEKPTIAELAESIETFRMVVQTTTTDISEEEWEGGRL